MGLKFGDWGLGLNPKDWNLPWTQEAAAVLACSALAVRGLNAVVATQSLAL